MEHEFILKISLDEEGGSLEAALKELSQLKPLDNAALLFEYLIQ